MAWVKIRSPGEVKMWWQGKKRRGKFWGGWCQACCKAYCEPGANHHSNGDDKAQSPSMIPRSRDSTTARRMKDRGRRDLTRFVSFGAFAER